MVTKKTANKKSRAKKPPSTDAESAQSTDKSANNVASTTGSRVVSWLALLFSVVALSAGGYVWYLTDVDSRLSAHQQENRFNTIEQRLDSFDVAQADVSAQIGVIQGEIAEQKSAVQEQVSTVVQVFNSQADGFRQQFNALSDSIIKLRGELDRGIDSWTLEEAEQLISIANQRMEFAGQFAGKFSSDSKLAKRALQYADERLQMLANPALNGVRQLLTIDIAVLDNLPTVDTVGVLNKLSSLSSTVENLVLAGDVVIAEKTSVEDASESAPELAEPTAVETEAETSVISRYTQPVIDAGASLFASFGELIQIEKDDKSRPSIISTEIRQMIYQKTQLMLDSAQIAFIRGQPALYQNQIQLVRNWVEENFDSNSSKTIEWLEQLDEVVSISPQSKIPDISRSLKAIRDVIKAQLIKSN